MLNSQSLWNLIIDNFRINLLTQCLILALLLTLNHVALRTRHLPRPQPGPERSTATRNAKLRRPLRRVLPHLSCRVLPKRWGGYWTTTRCPTNTPTQDAKTTADKTESGVQVFMLPHFSNYPLPLNNILGCLYMSNSSL